MIFRRARFCWTGRDGPLAIEPRQRNAATKLIEDFMLAANETVAEDYFWQGPALPLPDPRQAGSGEDKGFGHIYQ